MVEWNNVRDVEAAAIPPPPDGAFTVYAVLNATVPSIWVSGPTN